VRIEQTARAAVGAKGAGSVPSAGIGEKVRFQHLRDLVQNFRRMPQIGAVSASLRKSRARTVQAAFL